MTEHLNETTGELLPVPTSHANRTVDLRDHETDSWTDVFTDVVELSRGIATTEFVPKGLRGSVEKTTAAILYSRELGLAPMTGLGSVHVIEGKAGISAEMMRALILRDGHELAIKESTRDRCEIWGRRQGTEEWTRATWTIQEAHQTKVYISKEKGWGPLSSKSQWLSWPTEMLLARATTRLARQIFPDVIAGMRSVEELNDMTEESGPEAAVPEAPAPVQRKRAKARRPAAEDDQAGGQPAAPVRRARVSRPEPRGKTQAPVEAAPDAPTEDASVEPLVEAEVVQDVPASSTDEKAKKLVLIHFKRLGVEDRDERLFLTGVAAGRELSSTNDLTGDELRKVLRKLERARDVTALQDLVAKDQDDEQSSADA